MGLKKMLLLVVGALAKGISERCQREIDAYCNNAAACVYYPDHAPYYAVNDITHKSDYKEWRCYPASALDPTHHHYVHNKSLAEEFICSGPSKTLASMLQRCEAAPPAPSRNISVVTVFEGGTDGCVMYRTPSFVTIANGTLLAFTQCRQKSHSDESAQELHMKRSHDHGRTWSTSVVLPFAADPLFTTQHRAQTLYDKDTGAVFLFDDARQIGSGAPCHVQIWRTDDLGATWSSAANLTNTTANLTGSGLATGIQLPSGKLVLCMRAGCNGNKGGGLGDHTLWSDDHGVSWRAGGRLSDGTNECQLAALSNGSLVVNSRTGGNARLVSISDDEGISWSAAHTEPALSGFATVEASLISHGGSLFFSHPQAQDRSHLTIRRSRDDGETWPTTADSQVLVWEGPSAYSCLGSTADGTLAVLWEKDGKDLGFAKIEIPK